RAVRGRHRVPGHDVRRTDRARTGAGRHRHRTGRPRELAFEDRNGLGPAERDTSNGGAAAGDGQGIAIRRVTYGKGLGMYAAGEVSFTLGGACTEFAADAGVDDAAGLGGSRTRVRGKAAFTGLRHGAPPAPPGTRP